MITRSKNNLKKIYVVEKLCEKLNILDCNVVEIKYMDSMMIHNGRIVISYCSCKCGTLEYVQFKGDAKKFHYQLNNGIHINPLEFC